MKHNISVVIPVYKNKEMFMSNLKHNYSYLSDYEIIIVDDASQDHILEDVCSQYEHIHVIENRRNIGFAKTVNTGIQKTNGDYILLLNSDVKLTGSINSALDYFKDDKIFAVSFLQKDHGKMLGKNTIAFINGFPQHSKSDNFKKGINAWANGGASIIRKKYLTRLHNFNEVYSPFYWEDIDLSYRAYSRGWHVIFDPKIIVEHQRESTIRKYYSDSFITKISFRNQIIFTWTNITDITLLLEHIFQLPLYIASMILKGKFVFFLGLVQAFTLLPQIVSCRMENARHRVINDKEIFRMFS